MDFYSRKQVAEYFKVHPRTVERWLKNGSLKGHKLGSGRTSLWRISKAEVDRFYKKSENSNS